MTLDLDLDLYTFTIRIHHSKDHSYLAFPSPPVVCCMAVSQVIRQTAILPWQIHASPVPARAIDRVEVVVEEILLPIRPHT
jgi:hypothetical protein